MPARPAPSRIFSLRRRLSTSRRPAGPTVWPLLREMNLEHAAERPGDAQLTARLESYELAARLQLSAPELLDLTGETEATKRLYGLDQAETADFGKRCLLARRMAEQGVRFVQVWSGQGGGSDNWDNHTDIAKELGVAAKRMDQPAAALLIDLKARGLLEDTLLIWTTEFWPDAVQSRQCRPRPQWRYVRFLVRWRGSEAGGWRTVRATSGLGKPSKG